MPIDADQTRTTSLLGDQRNRWDRGERVPVEHFIRQQPELRNNTEVLLDLIYAEVVLRREVGEKPTADEYIVRFPALAEAIRMQFEVDGAIDSALTQPGIGGADDFRVYPQAPPGYEILEELGRGGMGVVYKARHRALDRLVALKMIRTGEFADTSERLRFEAEARAVAKLSHPNVIQIFEIGDINGLPYLALEFVAGESLADALRGDPFPPRSAAMLLATLARAIQHAHDAGIVHRDLKPANILLQKANLTELSNSSNDKTLVTNSRNGPWDTEIVSIGTEKVTVDPDIVPKITDFGLVKRIGSDGPTRTGDFLGTPNFTPPEQATGRSDLGPAADIYSLGAILYQMLTGRPPFSGATPIETLDQVRFAEPVPPSRLRPKLPRDLETITLKCLRKEPSRRYPTAAELADDLDRYLNGQVIQARPVGAFARFTKWCRRRPAIAGLLAFTILLATASFVTVTLLWQQAVSARDAEKSARADERGQRQRAEIRSAELLIANARYAWLTDDLEGARRALAECPESYHSEEWRTLDRACKASKLIVPPSTHPVECVAISRDGALIAGGSTSNRLVVWDSSTGEERLNIRMPDRTVRALTFTDDGRLAGMATVAVEGPGKVLRDGHALVFVDVADPRVRVAWQRPDRPYRMSVAPDGRHVAINTIINAKSTQVYDAATGQLAHQFDVNTERSVMRNVAFSPDGKHIGTSETPQLLRVWDVRTGLLIKRFATQETFFGTNALAVGPNGESVAVGVNVSGRTAELIILHRDDAKRIATQLNSVSEIAFSPDGRWIAAFSNSGSVVRVWNAATGREEITLRGHPSFVRSIAFRQDGRRLAVSYADGRVVLWSIEQ